jgi:hypothetical protein
MRPATPSWPSTRSGSLDAPLLQERLALFSRPALLIVVALSVATEVLQLREEPQEDPVRRLRVTLPVPLEEAPGRELLLVLGGSRGNLDGALSRAAYSRREVVGYRRGDGRIKIDVDTGSCHVVIAPAR